MQADGGAGEKRSGALPLPALARRILTLSLRINAADNIYQRHMQSARRQRLAALSASDYEAVRTKLIAFLGERDLRAHHLQGGGNHRDDASRGWPPEIADQPAALADFLGFKALEGVSLAPYRWGGPDGELPTPKPKPAKAPKKTR